MKKTALVTGASSGLGQATATLLAENGYEVWGTTRAESPADRGPVRMLTLELGSAESVAECASVIKTRAGRLDVLVNNAGFPLVGAVEEISLEEIEHEFHVNLFGGLRLTKALLPMMRDQGTGRIINISSAAAFIPVPFYGVYGASKAALERLSFSLRQELLPFGLHVSVVSPSSHRTGVQWTFPRTALAEYDGSRSRMASAMRGTVVDGPPPADVARVVLQAATSAHPKARYLVGTDARAFGFVQRLVSHGFIERLIRVKFKLGSTPAVPILHGGPSSRAQAKEK
jgi:NAD(P)-dependent dehydrogenase (short-subunit alcohol dehydrogenase family)